MFRENKSITYLYIVSHLGIFFITDAIYWDDWEIFNTPKEEIFNMFSQAGSFVPFTPYLHSYLLPIGPWSYRILTFVLFFVITYLFDKIILNSKLVNDETRYVLVLFFTILPFNIARVALINFPYTVCLTLFFLAWRYKHIRYISLPLFFLSFATNSLPFFYVIVMAHFYYEFAKDFKWGTILKFVKSRLDYLLLPIVYFAIKYTYYVPYGDFEGYNGSFSLYNLVKGPIWQVFDLAKLFSIMEINMVLFIVLFLVISYFLPVFKEINQFTYNTKNILILGIVSLLVCLFPYWIIGKFPTFTDWESRHQILMPFGVSIILGSIYCCFNTLNKKIFLILMSTISVTINVTNYFELFIDWNKQKNLVLALNNSELNLVHKTVYIQDNTFNVWDRTYRNYEWEGLLRSSSNRLIYSFSTVKSSASIKGVDKKGCINKECIFIYIDYEKKGEILRHRIDQSLFDDNFRTVIKTLEKFKSYMYPRVLLKEYSD